jgi:hypothetical protein
VIAGEATTQTNTWLIAESHSESPATNECGNKISEEMASHTFLLEGVQSGKQVTCSKYKIEDMPGRTCEGWDDLDALEKFNDAFAESRMSIALDDLEKGFYQKKYSDESFDQLVKTSLKQINMVEKESKKNPLIKEQIKGTQPKVLRSAFTWLQKERQKQKSYTSVFKSPSRPRSTDLVPIHVQKAMGKAHFKRQVSLVNSLSKVKGPKILVAGEAHLNKMTQNIAIDEVSKSAEYVENKLEERRKQDPENNSFAILRK